MRLSPFTKVQSPPVDDIGAIVHAGESKALAIEALNEENKKKQISNEAVDNVTIATTINKTIR